MATFIVTFQVDDPSRRHALKTRMKSYDGYCPIHENCWAILTDQQPAAIRDYLDSVLLPQDRIFIIRSGTLSAWRNAYSDQNSEWLKERL